MIKKINEAFDHRFEAALDEALPKDLMQQIRSAANVNNNSWDKARFNTSDAIRTEYNPETRRWDKPATGIKDYQNATYQEVSPQEILKRKKNGDDLSNVYVMKKDPWYGTRMIKLDAEGHPEDSKSSIKGLRSNQSLTSTLKDADKIYVADIKDFLDSDPEKAHSRLQPDDYGNISDIRHANMYLGHNRPVYSSDKRRDSDYIRNKREQSGNKAKINAIKAQYEAGDISRKEMEKRIANLEPYISDYSIKNYNNVRNRNAKARYKASEIALQKPFNDLDDYRGELDDAKRDLSKAKKELQQIKDGTADTYTGDLYDYNFNRNKLKEYQAELAKLQAQIESTQEYIDKYSKLVNDDAKNAELDKYQKKIDDQTARMKSAQDNLDKLLRRK